MGASVAKSRSASRNDNFPWRAAVPPPPLPSARSRHFLVHWPLPSPSPVITVASLLVIASRNLIAARSSRAASRCCRQHVRSATLLRVS
ncbi:hypothetical protein PIB30_072134, partial [Stylosanthes scabra]|nr:hypothetical protein [Stylosanthes scabra]